jgi:hypothetical protein
MNDSKFVKLRHDVEFLESLVNSISQESGKAVKNLESKVRELEERLEAVETELANTGPRHDH